MYKNVHELSSRFFIGIEHICEGIWRFPFSLIPICLAPGYFIWVLFFATEVSFIRDNRFPLSERLELIATMLTSGSILFLLYLVFYIRNKRSGLDTNFYSAVRRLNRYLICLASLLFLPSILYIDYENKSHWLNISLIIIVSICLAISFYFILKCRTVRFPRRFERKRFVFALSALTASMLFYSIWLSRLAFIRHYNLNTKVNDMGIYEQVFWQTAHGNMLGCSFLKTGNHISNHFDPILILFTPIYMLAPKTETLLALQSVWLATGAIPLYFIALHSLKRQYFASLTFPICYLLNPALHGANMFDFHSLTLVVPLLLWALLFIEKRLWFAYAVSFILILLVREDMALLSCFIGFYCIISKASTRAGTLTIIVALVWFVVVKSFLMPTSDSLLGGGALGRGYSYYYKELIYDKSLGIWSMLSSVLSNPSFVFSLIFREEKVFYFLVIFLPLFLLPLLSGRKIVLVCYGLLFIFLSSKTQVHKLGYQYSSVLVPFAFGIAPAGLNRLSLSSFAQLVDSKSSRIVSTVSFSMVVVSLLICHEYGVFWQNKFFRGGPIWFQHNPSEHMVETYNWLKEVTKSIPEDASVSATNYLAAHIASRREAYRVPDNLGRAKYLLIRPNKLHRKHRRKLKKLVYTKVYREIYRHSDIVVYERISD